MPHNPSEAERAMRVRYFVYQVRALLTPAPIARGDF
jgi:hypothetical protein